MLNNIGIVGSCIVGVADVIFVVIFVIGIKIDIQPRTYIVYAIVNALVGVTINVLLRYQGKRYAEIENKELCEKFYKKRIKERKKPIPMDAWLLIMSVKDFIIKGCTTTFSITALIYLSIEGSKNPVQILMTIANLLLFTCFGLMNLNSSYQRFYNIQKPFMENELNKNNMEV